MYGYCSIIRVPDLGSRKYHMTDPGYVENIA